MISVTELRAGTVFEDHDQVFQVLSYEHIKMGRGSANIKVRVKNIQTGATTDKSFINGARVNDLYITKKNLQYLYQDKEKAFFMNEQNFEQIEVPIKVLEGDKYLKPGENFSLSFLDNKVIGLNLPSKMEFKVVDTEPGVKGNSATNIYKDAILENNIRTKVPLFIKNGDRVVIDTRTGAYAEKAS